MAKERFVTRRVIESKEYKVYKKDGNTLIELGTIEAKGKVSEKELAEEYKVDKVFIELVSENKITYGVPVDEFMKYAVALDEDGKPIEAKEENQESQETQTA